MKKTLYAYDLGKMRGFLYNEPFIKAGLNDYNVQLAKWESLFIIRTW